MSKFRIGILGAGAVGGFVGGKLAARYQHSEIEIVFIVRGKNKSAIRDSGIKIITPDYEFISHPSVTSDNLIEIGELDLLIITVKSYDLQHALAPLISLISPHTYILSLINGVDAKQQIEKIFPAGIILDGFIYIVAHLLEPGTVQVLGKGHSLYFGNSKVDRSNLDHLRSIFIEAGINAITPDDIIQSAWEKFFFISTMATVTSYLDKSIHEILNSPGAFALWQDLLIELKSVATAKEIPMAENIIDISIAKANALPQDATTSMLRDYRKKSRTEVDSLTGYVVREARFYKIDAPLYTQIYKKLLTLNQQ